MALEKVQKYFEGTELADKIIVLEQSSATVELAAQALKTEPDRIAKTLSFLVENQAILIVVSGESKIDNKKYKGQFGAKAKMIPFDDVEQWIGHAPGGVCPFGVNEEVKTYLDVSLKKYDTVFPAAGNGNSAVEMNMEQLEKFSRYVEWIDVCKSAE